MISSRIQTWQGPIAGGGPLRHSNLLRKSLIHWAARSMPGPRILFVKFAGSSTVLAYPAILRAIEMVGRELLRRIRRHRFILDAMEIISRWKCDSIATKSVFELVTGALRAVPKSEKSASTRHDMEFLTRSPRTDVYDRRQIACWVLTLLATDRTRRLMTHRLLYNPHLHTSQMFEAMVKR